MTIDASEYVAHKSPGKFEGESPATEYFYEQMLNGDGEAIFPYGEDDIDSDAGYCATLFQVSAEEADAFGLECGSWFLLREDSQGFAIGTEHETRDEAEHRFNEWAGAPCPESCEVCRGAS
jgi:hypothetical protein